MRERYLREDLSKLGRIKVLNQFADGHPAKLTVFQMDLREADKKPYKEKKRALIFREAHLTHGSNCIG